MRMGSRSQIRFTYFSVREVAPRFRGLDSLRPMGRMILSRLDWTLGRGPIEC